MIEIKEKISVLFVCMGNICRSPTAEGVFRHYVTGAGLADQIEADSAGTHAYHVGEPADRRATAAAERRGVSLAGIRARRVSADDFERFDYIIAMDQDNQMHLLDQAPDEHRSKVQLFLSFSSEDESEVPDPYYGGKSGFDTVFSIVSRSCEALFNVLEQET